MDTVRCDVITYRSLSDMTSLRTDHCALCRHYVPGTVRCDVSTYRTLSGGVTLELQRADRVTLAELTAAGGEAEHVDVALVAVAADHALTAEALARRDVAAGVKRPDRVTAALLAALRAAEGQVRSGLQTAMGWSGMPGQGRYET